MSLKQRYFIELAYKGTAYHGWQIQNNAVSVQEVLNKALSTVLRQDIETIGCGRTDTGVHATQLYAHFDVELANSDESQIHNSLLSNSKTTQKQSLQTLNSKLLTSVNALLPYDVAAKRFIAVAADAHARFDAKLRSYQYHVHFKKDPFKHGNSWLLMDRPDAELMNNAAKLLLEYRDFSCFSKSNTQTFTNNCIISRAEWEINADSLIFHISADRFLRNMVRAIVGTLIMVGRKEIEPDNLRQIIEGKNRCKAGASVPACGLYLTEVIYPYIKKS